MGGKATSRYKDTPTVPFTVLRFVFKTQASTGKAKVLDMDCPSFKHKWDNYRQGAYAQK
jgi:hypothetical protein